MKEDNVIYYWNILERLLSGEFPLERNKKYITQLIRWKNQEENNTYGCEDGSENN
jgi:hypothetical protein